MKTQRFMQPACLALLLVMSAGVTQAAEGIAGQKQFILREGEATWIGQAKPHARHGGEPAMAIGANDGALRGLIRFDLSTRMASYDTITQAVLELTLAEVKGTWGNETIELYQVNDGRWGAASATWASANDSDIIMLGSGEPIRTAWNQPGCEGWSRGAKVSEAKVSSTDKGQTIRFTITDAKFLAALRNLAHHPDPQANGGFQLTAPGLAAKPGAAALFATWKAALPQRPVLKLDVAGYAPPKTVLRYELEKGGRVSIVIHAPDGKLVRELLHGVERSAGKNEEGWDGKDEQGNLLPAGAYSWKLLRTSGLQAEYLLTLGTNPKTPWEVWPGNHNPVTSVAVDESGLYFASGSNEGPPMMVKQSPDEKLLWSAPNFGPFGGAQSLCADGGKIFLIETGSKRPNRLDAATGKRESTLDAIPAGNNPLLHMAMAARNGRLLVSYFDKNLIRWFDFEGKPLGESAVAEPAGVVLLKNGDALVISQGAVVRVALGGNKPAPLIEATLLTAPWRLDVAANGDILVAESDEMRRWAQRELKQPESTFPADKGRQVKRFGADGKLKAAYGRPGGRAWYGPYKPEDGFGKLLDITATRDGGFLAVDLQNPNRTVAYDAKGTIQREWYGGQTYGPNADVDPEDPSLVYMSYGWGGIVRYKVDYAKRTWKVDAVFDTDAPMWRANGSNDHLFLRRREGKLLMMSNITPEVFELDEKNGTLKPMSVLSFPAGGGPNPPETILKQMKPDGNWKQYVYSWVDTNGNGQPEDDEFTFPGGNFGAGGMYVDNDFNYYLALSGNLRQWLKLNVGYVRLAPQGFTKHGAPIYDNTKQERLGEPPMDEYGFGQYEDVAIWRDADGSVYCIYNTNNDKKFGQGFWSPRTGGNRVARWNAAGKLQWVVGRHSATGGAAPGEGRYFWRIMGTTHDCIVVGDMENSLQHVWDRDGLWVGRLLESPLLTKGVPPEAFQVCGEQFGGSLYTNPKTGEVLFFGSGLNNVPVFRITGWDGWTRKVGTVEIKP
ncbi:MAG: FlgD immunoglobulin-like domain containing protein [Planctomycetota bacterium]